MIDNEENLEQEIRDAELLNEAMIEYIGKLEKIVSNSEHNDSVCQIESFIEDFGRMQKHLSQFVLPFMKARFGAKDYSDRLNELYRLADEFFEFYA